MPRKFYIHLSTYSQVSRPVTNIEHTPAPAPTTDIDPAPAPYPASVSASAPVRGIVIPTVEPAFAAAHAAAALAWRCPFPRSLALNRTGTRQTEGRGAKVLWT